VLHLGANACSVASIPLGAICYLERAYGTIELIAVDALAPLDIAREKDGARTRSQSGELRAGPPRREASRRRV